MYLLQSCSLKFGSWSHNGHKINLSLENSLDTDVLSDEGFQDNGEWQLIKAFYQRNVEIYPCCPEPYIDITLTINIRRRTLYYFSNFIGPCVLISRYSSAHWETLRGQVDIH